VDALKEPLLETDVNAGRIDATMRYRQRYGRQDRIFRFGDQVLRAIMRPRPGADLSHLRPRRILLVNAGHLGDAVLTTGLIPVLRDAFPGVEIGFLTGTYSRNVVEAHPLIDRTHFIDHWQTSRQTASRWRKMLAYAAALPGMVRELRSVQSDVAIDVRSWFPNLIGLLWLTRIPVRIGYDRLGGGPLLTHPVTYVHHSLHEFDYHVALLASLPIPEKSLAAAWPTIAPPSTKAQVEAHSVVSNSPRYCILHPVASTPTRDWKLEHWCELARLLVANNITPVVTGVGKRAKALAGTIVECAPGAIDAVDALSWPGLVALVANAEAIYSVETAIGHVAAALRRPVLSICGGMSESVRWAPLGAAVVTKRLPCHPCFIKAGCAHRDCILGVSVQDVMVARHALADAVGGCTKRPSQAA
jgi:ADP-heptose:LPS heptosyltransferase